MNEEKWLDDSGNEITDEYVIISKTSTQERIEELEKEKEISDNNQETTQVQIQYWLIGELKQILAYSTPLIPEIEKAFDAAQEVDIDSVSPLNEKEDYISNLKLNLGEGNFNSNIKSRYVEKQKLEFAIDMLNELEFNPKEPLSDFVINIKSKIEELKQKLSAL